MYGGVSESSLRLTMTGGCNGRCDWLCDAAGAPKGCGTGFAAVRGSGAGPGLAEPTKGLQARAVAGYCCMHQGVSPPEQRGHDIESPSAEAIGEPW